VDAMKRIESNRKTSEESRPKVHGWGIPDNKEKVSSICFSLL
jgi:hypothetical protein